ncbi:hypothetical protein KBD59_03325 [Candidatus Gracilibacteria bacterium]|nr:hypothetical protein [Candidatus Gracilibacteria bacterium]
MIVSGGSASKKGLGVIVVPGIIGSKEGVTVVGNSGVEIVEIGSIIWVVESVGFVGEASILKSPTGCTVGSSFVGGSTVGVSVSDSGATVVGLEISIFSIGWLSGLVVESPKAEAENGISSGWMVKDTIKKMTADLETSLCVDITVVNLRVMTHSKSIT